MKLIKTLNISLVIFSILFWSSSVGYMIDANAESVGFIKSQMTDAELEKCEIMVISENFYVPVRFELEHPPLPDFDGNAEKRVRIATDAELQFERQDEVFVFLTETVDRHDIQLEFDYTDDEPMQRQVYYRIYSESDIISEGTWYFTEPVFCKYFSFLALEPPPVYDAKYFEEKYDEVHGNRLSTIITNQEEAESFNLSMGVMGLFGIFVGSFVSIVVFYKFKDLKKSLPIKELRELIGTITGINNNADDLINHTNLTMQRAKDVLVDVTNKLIDEKNRLIQILSGMKPEQIEPLVRIEQKTVADDLELQDVELIKEDGTKGIFKVFVKAKDVVKDQFFETKGKQETLEEFEKRMIESNRETINKELADLTKKINKDTNNEILRQKYDIASKVIQKK